MQDDEIKALSDLRMEHAVECLETAKKVLEFGDYKSAANRSYYAVFHAMRAVLAYDDIQKTKHSGIISEFRRLYIKTGVFDSEMCDIISNLFDIRTNSDYNDFFVVAKDDVKRQVAGAETFIISLSSTTCCKRFSKQNPENPANEEARKPVNIHGNNSQQN